MQNKILKKVLVVGIIVLFFGICITPSLGISISKIDSITSFLEHREIIFQDDFNDNEKNYNKWTEIYDKGYWYERNQRTEFKVNEYGGGGNYTEGIESTEFNVLISSTESIILRWDLLTDIGSTGWVAHPFFVITDGTNWIQASYYEWYHELRVKDSNGTSIVLNENHPIGTWNNEIEIFSDRYIVRMDADESGWINKAIFSPNPTFKIRMYLRVGGLQPHLYSLVGFDNVMVECHSGENQPPNVPIINGPLYGRPDNVYNYIFSSEDPDNDEVCYEILWGDGTYEEWLGPFPSNELVIVNHSWSGNGKYIIMARAKDDSNSIGQWAKLEIMMFRGKSLSSSPLLRFLQRYPLLNRLLNLVK